MRRTRIALLKLFGATIEWSCGVDSSAQIIDPWNLSMGNRSSIGEHCCIRCRDRVTIGKYCCISRGVDILTGSHNISSPNFSMVTSPVKIEDNCWVATKAMISKGVTLGEGCVVAACSNVIKSVEPWSVVGGNPAKFIKQRIITSLD